jgi:hypothetical protein
MRDYVVCDLLAFLVILARRDRQRRRRYDIARLRAGEGVASRSCREGSIGK